MTNTMQHDTEKTYRLAPLVISGLALGAFLVIGVGGWAATARLSGAVIAMGTVTVDQNLKSIQHRDGGIVSDIAVREGDLVAQGQVLIRLEDAQTRAELSIVQSQLAELMARRARLMAERDGLTEIAFPDDLLTGDHAAMEVVTGAIRLFDGNRANRDSQRRQLMLGIDQISDEIEGLKAQRESKADETRLSAAEQLRIVDLTKRKLSETTRLYAVNREVAQLSGQLGEIDAEIARARTRISEINLQIIAIDETSRTEAQRELSQVETRIAELRDRKLATEDRLRRTDIRAPIGGTVNQLSVHTIGGVISPAEVLVTIVPENARLWVEARVPPASIDQVAPGQSARLRFSAFNHRTTPELNGTISHVSAATNRDPATGETYYLARVGVTDAELEKLGDQMLMPGMPVEIFMTTEERTALSYLVRPITDQFSRALRER
ncbi:MAG: HlyD family type I secretion periplasmic adaptor subunit [Paracoccaceae bacterium]